MHLFAVLCGAGLDKIYIYYLKILIKSSSSFISGVLWCLHLFQIEIS